MTENLAPDSWEMQEEDSLSNNLSTLDVNAPVFIPNINAPEFVPTFMKETKLDPVAPDPPPEPAGSINETVGPPSNWTSINNSNSNSTSSLSEPVSSGGTPTMNTPTDLDSSIPKVPTLGTKDPSPTSDGPIPADSWEEAADAFTPSPSRETPSTPDDDEDDEEDTSESDSIERRKKKISCTDADSDVKKEPVNVIFIGHVDAGKSTIGGQIMYLTGMVDKRTLEKYEREAKEKNRETWYLSWALDTNLEERDKGKTVEVGRAYFETESKHFTILDAPGHKSFVPNMIGGACQADLAVLVISARKGEFETGFDRGGQTREHAMLAKTAGVKHLIVLINKMDDSTVNWQKSRYEECKDKLIPYLKKVGFNPSKDIQFMPCSGLNGTNLRTPIDSKICPWYDGPAFIPYINDLPPLNRNLDGPFMMPIVDRYNDRGTIVMGKVESGNCQKGDSLLVMPNRTAVTLDCLWRDDDEVNAVHCGENVKIKLRGVEEADVTAGFVLTDPSNPCKTGRVFDAKVVILEHKSIICAGYSAVCHMHSVAEEVTVQALFCLVDRRTNEKSKVRPRFVKQDQAAIMRFVSSGTICMEAFTDHPQLGRFTLRDEGKTIAIGKVLKVVE